jgi:hypothetical protein
MLAMRSDDLTKQYSFVLLSIVLVNNSLKFKNSHFVSVLEDFFTLFGTIYVPIFCLITGSTVHHANGTGVPLVTYVAILSEGR